jgi:hypothetical protein
VRLKRSAARALARVAIVALTVGASGCSAIGELTEPAAARELDLTNTFWAVSDAGGRRVTEPATMVFTDLDNVTLSTACGADRASVTMDTDGSAIGFDQVQRGTIMFPESQTTSITGADRATLKLLYTLPPGSVR